MRKRSSRIKCLILIVVTACLLAFTVYISLDTFVLTSAYQTDATEINLSSIKSAVKTDTVPEAVSAQDDGSSKNTDVQSDGSSSESSRHRKKPGEGHGGPGGEHGDGQGGGHGSGCNDRDT